ncbi:MAG: Uma2 family endonuclease [Bacteroidetes bacterium]|nr:Uma2 family endonuclease [Bacteroidota bacterium]
MQTTILEKESIRKRVLPITVKQYHHWLEEAGSIGEKTELLNGIIIEIMTITAEHTYIVDKIYELLRKLISGDIYIRKEHALTLKKSEPEPDIAIVEGNMEKYKISHPGTALLVIEIAVSSLDIDREKASIYAQANIPEYWLFDIKLKRIEVYSQPFEDSYRKKKIYNITDSIPLKIGKEKMINLKEIF